MAGYIRILHGVFPKHSWRQCLRSIDVALPSGRSRWLRRKILLLPIFQSLIDGADLPDGAEELFATSIALDGHLHAPTRNSAALKSVRLFDNHRLTRGIQRQLMTYIMALKNIETLACLGAQLVDAAPGTAVINSAQIIEGHLHREIAWDLGDCLLDLLAVLNDLGSWWLGPS